MKFLTLGEKTNPAILMLHGTLCSGEGSRSLGERLAEDHYVILPTYDGCDGGKSVYDSAAGQAQKILTWLQENGIRSLALGQGTSMGAEVLMAFALLAEKQCYPVRQYVFDGGPFFHFPKPVQFVMEKKFQGLADQLRGKEGPETVKKLLANPMVQKLIGTDTAPYQEMGTDMTRVCQTADRVSIRNMVRTCYTFGFHAVKPEVQKRFYFLWSEKEPARKSEKKMRETYPQARFRVVPGYMHCGYQICAPETYVQEMRALLEKQK